MIVRRGTMLTASQFFPTPVGMIEILSRRGFRPDEKSHPGNIHYEKYW